MNEILKSVTKIILLLVVIAIIFLAIVLSLYAVVWSAFEIKDKVAIVMAILSLITMIATSVLSFFFGMNSKTDTQIAGRSEQQESLGGK